jgi:hypothetical protein
VILFVLPRGIVPSLAPRLGFSRARSKRPAAAPHIVEERA